ncbi:cytochrome P450 [Massilia sp. Mn16-1_5]|uniref:cytochrome P450 n=1 Tax=Massilia sp. Mn16-1_5 TaxID=2079199 RepID=UPI00109E792A|nr:cytochrome P450 [Massilia sp. Mn16-1_5]THC45023.1 cytochrome P450 [Massilia sp. Mn16-1_5]
MKPDTTSGCPFHAAAVPRPLDQSRAPSIWPPGPAPGLTGWGLLRAMSRDPLGSLERWRRQHGDVVHLRIWPEHQVVLTDPALVRELLITQHEQLVRWERGIAVMSQLHGRSVLTAEGPLWLARRQALQPAFTPKASQSYVPVIATAAQQAFAGWRAGEEGWPIEQAFTSLGMDVILRTMFSSAIDADARLAERAVHTVSVAGNAEMYWPASWPDWMPWKAPKRRAMRVLRGLIERHVTARLALAQEEWPADLLTRLLALHRTDPAAWPLRAVQDECMTAFLAGHETAAATLTWWAWCMAANPAAQTAAREEVDSVLQGRVPAASDLPQLGHLKRTLQETLRLYPAAPVLLTRRTRQPIALGGWRFPARTMFTVPVGLLQRDPRLFPEPEAFRPERFAGDASDRVRGAWMPFGTGPRVCIGQHLALAEMTVIAAMFLQRFTVRPRDNMAPPEPVFNITLRPREPLRLVLERREA